jgi:hypothetical protein
MASRESRRKSAFCFWGPWHFWQCAINSGRILASKKRTCSGDAGFSAALHVPAMLNQHIAEIMIQLLKRGMVAPMGWLCI